MNSVPSDDPLVSLWQTAPKPNTQHLLQDLQRVNRLHRGTNRSVLAILCGLSLLFLFEEATGRLATHGALSALWIVGLTAGIARHRRVRCSRLDALASDTVSLLKSMIARAKSDLFLARCLYAGIPCGAAAGALAMKLVGSGSPAIAVDARLRLIQTGAGVAALIAMVVTGAILARSRRQQVRELSVKADHATALCTAAGVIVYAAYERYDSGTATAATFSMRPQRSACCLFCMP